MENNNKKNNKSAAALREERVLQFWKENKIFSKTLSATKGKKEFIFYEGPPTANGKPGIHHLATRAFKDAIPRYKTMRGYHVRRKGGWDTHGLAVEIQTEKKLGLNSKKAIEEYGIAKFNQECKESVWEYLDVWNKFTERVGYWVDQDNPYVTYHNDYIESVWNVVKKINERGLLYKDYKVVPWCPRCGTALSSHELAQGYQDDKDLSVTAKFKLLASPDAFPQVLGSLGPRPQPDHSQKHAGEANNTYMFAWTTTPWTLPGNVALAVGEDIDYVKIKTTDEIKNEIYILAKARLDIISEPYEIVQEIKGRDLVGLEYEPLYPFLKNLISPKEKSKLENAYKVYTADFVTTEDGTGIVHTAVMYGQDDFELGTKVGLPKQHLVGPDGKFLPGTGIFAGRFVKDEDVAVDIIKDLAHRGLLFKKEKFEHSYPHCWRCHTALIYYARDSWYIKMSDTKIKKELISQNKEINWEPAYIREGRFGQWLEEIKDWAVSRERYWGTPLPVWVCETCKKITIIGSISDLKAKTKKSGNKYFVMRHGGTEANIKDAISFKEQSGDKLTAKGRDQVATAALKIADKKIDLIIASPFTRTRETAELVKEKLGLKPNQIIFDARLAEINVGNFDGKNWEEYHKHLVGMGQGWFGHKVANGESLLEVSRRTGEVIYELEDKYKNKNILIVTHGGPAWLLFVNSGFYSPENKPYEIPHIQAFVADFKRFKNAEARELPFIPLPHNPGYELDLHRPYIDEAILSCAQSAAGGQACGGNLIRTKEVMDVWLDSGCVPFAQDHYPFENKKWVEGAGYPADFISEGIDQTRGWFYTLHAVGILMERGKAYKNVICLGLLMDAAGKKMSKSVGNVVDPWIMMDKYGVDTLRFWMYSVNQPGESKNFDEKTVALTHSQVFGLIYNVLAFYELYPAPEQARYGASRDKNLEKNNGQKRPVPKNILDSWILTRLDELIEMMTKNLDDYKLLEPVRAIKDFVGDLSTWYLRRSRERIKSGEKEARITLYFVLKTLAKVLAPFAPFAAEDIWLKLRNENDFESVHLEKWPAFRKVNLSILKNMQIARDICTAGNAERQKFDIPVRQPLRILFSKVAVGEEYQKIIKEELNVKEFETDIYLENTVELDKNITEELKQEGYYRELARVLQDMRKKLELTPSDVVSLIFETNDAGKRLIKKFEKDLRKTVLVSKIEFKKNNGPASARGFGGASEEIKIDEFVFKIKMER